MSTPFFEETRSGGCQPAFAFGPVLPNHRQLWTEEKQSVNGSSRGRKMCDANRTDVILPSAMLLDVAVNSLVGTTPAAAAPRL